MGSDVGWFNFGATFIGLSSMVMIIALILLACLRRMRLRQLANAISDLNHDPPIAQFKLTKLEFGKRVFIQILMLAVSLTVTFFFKSLLLSFIPRTLWSENPALHQLLILLLPIILVMPFFIALQAVYFRYILTAPEEERALYIDLLFEILGMPTMLFLLWVIALEWHVNRFKGVPARTMKRRFPGWTLLFEWVFERAQRVVPLLPVPAKCVIYSLVFGWLVMLFDSLVRLFLSPACSAVAVLNVFKTWLLFSSIFILCACYSFCNSDRRYLFHDSGRNL